MKKHKQTFLIIITFLAIAGTIVSTNWYMNAFGIILIGLVSVIEYLNEKIIKTLKEIVKLNEEDN